MSKEFIPYELAVKLKELGFDEPCFTYYYNDNSQIRTGLSIHINNGWTYKGTKRLETTLAPLYQQAFRWFREKYDLTSWVYTSQMSKFYYTILYGRYVKSHESSNTYEEAELACLEKLIEIVKGG